MSPDFRTRTLRVVNEPVHRIHLIRATRHFALAMDDADRSMARIVPLD